MSDATTISAARIEAERDRLFALLPAHIRSIDAANGDGLQALVQVLAASVAEVEGEIDTLYDALFAETAPEAMLGDLGALIAAEPLRPLPAGTGQSMRAFVANTLRYRRGKGTARIVEALASDVGGFGAVAVEYYMRLARLAHLVDVRPERPGLAAIQPGTTAAATATAFDRLPRLADIRSIARAGGRHHVPNVGVHILRPVAPHFAAPGGTGPYSEAALAGVPLARPWRIRGQVRSGYFQLAPVDGEPLRMFNPDRRSQDATGRVVASDLADRLQRLPLWREVEELRHSALEGRAASLDESPWFDAAGMPFAVFLGRRVAGELVFTRVPPAQLCIANLEQPPSPVGVRPEATRPHRWYSGSGTGPVEHVGTSPIACAIDPVTGRLIVAKQPPGRAVEEVRVAYASGIGRDRGAGPHDRNDDDVAFEVIDSPAGSVRVWLVGPSDVPTPAGVTAVASLRDALDAWNLVAASGLRGFIVLQTCDRSAGAASLPVRVPAGSEVQIVAARWVAPRVRAGLAVDPARLGFIVRKDRLYVVDAPLRVGSQPVGSVGGRLVLDGLSLTSGIILEARALSDLSIRHCTLRAPGSSALSTTAALAGTSLAITRSIVGRVNLDVGSALGTGRIAMTDSIVGSDGAAGDALAARRIDAELCNVTLLGTMAVKSLSATSCLFDSPVSVARTQAGCVRYSWVAPGSIVPRRFRCQPDLGIATAIVRKGSPLTSDERDTVRLSLTPELLDRALAEPTAAMLHPMTGDAIARGGEGESEMGAFSAAAVALRMANVRSLFDDYLPFGTEAGLIDDTRSSAVAARRNRP